MQKKKKKRKKSSLVYDSFFWFRRQKHRRKLNCMKFIRRYYVLIHIFTESAKLKQKKKTPPIEQNSITIKLHGYGKTDSILIEIERFIGIEHRI